MMDSKAKKILAATSELNDATNKVDDLKYLIEKTMDDDNKYFSATLDLEVNGRRSSRRLYLSKEDVLPVLMNKLSTAEKILGMRIEEYNKIIK